MSTTTNFYKVIPKKYHHEQVDYASKSALNISIPSMMCVVGSTGSGKTNCTLNLISQINCFTKIYLFAKNLEEPLYAYFIDRMRIASRKCKEPILIAENDIDKLPDVNSIDKDETNLLIVDDMITEKSKHLSRVAEYWIRGRKQNCTCVFISQSYYDIPLLIRKNTGYFIFLKINTQNDLKRIIKEFSLGVEPKQMMDMYKQATAGKLENFFMIDVLTGDDRLRFRQNFTPIGETAKNTQQEATRQVVQRKRPRKEDEDEDEESDDDLEQQILRDHLMQHARRYIH